MGKYWQRIRKIYRFIFHKIVFFFIEKKYKGKLKYIFENNHSDQLIVVFSGFAVKVPKYNYMRTLKDSKIDKLFILDNFGYRGSYYWFENGKDELISFVKGLISEIYNQGGYKKIYMAGSSKGGTCAIYYGLLYGATDIFAGACQYHIGTYLNVPEHRKVLEGMMGKNAGEKEIKILNEMMPSILKKFSHSSSLIHLCYSKDEHTYKDHIVDLMEDLKKNDIKFVEQVDSYNNHGENGIYFAAYLKKFFGI